MTMIYSILNHCGSEKSIAVIDKRREETLEWSTEVDEKTFPKVRQGRKQEEETAFNNNNV